MFEAAIKAPDLLLQKLQKLPFVSWSAISTESDSYYALNIHAGFFCEYI